MPIGLGKGDAPRVCVVILRGYSSCLLISVVSICSVDEG